MTANVNVTKVLFKRGNTAQNAAYTGINGEITVDTQVKTLRIHDGVTTGGNIVTAGAMASYIPTDPTITSIQANVAAANAAISAITGIDTSLLANAATQQTQINLLNANVAAANALIPNLLAVSGNILPSANITYSLGSEQFQWRDLWVSNNTIYIGNTPVRVDGNTLLINGAPVSGAYGNTQVAAYLPTYTGNITAGNLTITGNLDQPNRGFGNGPGTDLYITAGHTQGCSIPGGDTIISGGLGYGGVAWYGGNVTLRTGRLTSNNYSNQWNFAYDGTLTLPNADFGYSPIEPAILFPVPGFNGSKIQIANNGLTITAETQTWTFGTDGNLTFPTGGNLIFDSSATSVIDGVTNITANGNVTAAQYNFANGVNIFDTITGVTSISSSVSTLTVSDASGDYTYGALSYDYAVNGVTSGGFTISYSAPLVHGNVDISVGNVTVAGNVVQQGAYYETFSNVTNSGGNLTCNFANSAVFYATLTANVTANIYNVTATAGRVTSVTLIVDQGATPYGVANIQINGAGIQTIKWAGGTGPNTGTASNTDVMSFSLISLDGTSWRILGQVSNYG